jgi:hypothetical protein
VGNLTYKIFKRGEHPRTILVNVYDDDSVIGHFLCYVHPYCPKCYPKLHCNCAIKKEKLWIMRSGPQVRRAYRRTGIASNMYRLAECFFGLRVMPDGKASEEGAKFRDGYHRKYTSWENDYKQEEIDSNLPEVEIYESGGEFIEN